MPCVVPPESQQSGNVNGGFAGLSQARLHACVDAPLKGSLHGAQRFPVAHVA